MIGVHTVVVVGEDAADEIDLSCYVDEISIQHGRTGPSGQPEASSATVDLTVSPDEPLPDILDVGATLVVSTRLTEEDAESTRFVGRVTDLNFGWDEAGEFTPDAGTGQIMAVGPLNELGRRIIGDEPFPQEMDGARVARIMALAGYVLDPLFSDPGTVQILRRDVDARAALEVASDTATSASGIIWQTRDAEIRYADADHRRNMTPVLTLDACDLLVSPTWVRNTQGIVNQVSISYGEVPEGGEQARYQNADPASQTRWGRYDISQTTELVALADAQAMGLLMLTRNRNPAWVMNAIPVDLGGLDAERTRALLGVDVNTLILLTGLPAIGQAPTSFPAWVEGWTERLAWGVHEIEIVISDYCRTSPPPRWEDLPAAYTWDSIEAGSMRPGFTWDDATCLGPVATQGRWADVPASYRWDRVDNAATWDSWTG